MITTIGINQRQILKSQAIIMSTNPVNVLMSTFFVQHHKQHKTELLLKNQVRKCVHNDIRSSKSANGIQLSNFLERKLETNLEAKCKYTRSR